jgi:hypothetical protein
LRRWAIVRQRNHVNFSRPVLHLPPVLLSDRSAFLSKTVWLPGDARASVLPVADPNPTANRSVRRVPCAAVRRLRTRPPRRFMKALDQ